MTELEKLHAIADGLLEHPTKAKYYDSAARHVRNGSLRNPTNRRLAMAMNNDLTGLLRKAKLKWDECPVPPLMLRTYIELVEAKAWTGKRLTEQLKEHFPGGRI